MTKDMSSNAYTVLPSDYADDSTAPASSQGTEWDQRQDALWSGQKADTSHLLGSRVEQSDNPDAVRNLDQQWTSDRQPAPQVQGGVDLSSARTPEGMRVNSFSALSLTDVVSVDGMEINVETAVTLGFLRKSNDGGFVPTGAAADGQQQQEEPSAEQRWEADQAKQNADNPIVMEPATQALLDQAVAQSPTHVVGAAASLIHSDGDFSHAVAQVVDGFHLEPSVAHERIAAVTEGYAKEAYVVSAREAATSPAIAEEALQAFRKSNPTAFRDAATQHFATGKPAYGAAIESHLINMEKADPHGILNANPVPGRSVRWDPSYNCIIVKDTTTGQETDWETAIRQKWISIK